MFSTFSICSNITQAPSIPDRVTTLRWTFENCYKLSIGPDTIPSSVKDMGRTFCNCKKLQSVPNRPECVDSMNWCFAGCTMLDQHIVIPSTVPELVSTFEDSGIDRKTVTVKANLISSSNWKNTFKGVARVFVQVVSSEAGLACESADGWDDNTMAVY